MWRERAAVFAYLVMESLIWFVLAAVCAAGAGSAGPAYLTFLIAMAAGYGLVRALVMFDADPRALVLAGCLLTLAGLQLLLHVQQHPGGNPLSLVWLGRLIAEPEGYLATRWPEAWGVFFAAAAWLRAAFVAQKRFTYARVMTSFSLGVAVLLLLLLLGQGGGAEGAINGAAVPFFVAGLTAIALVQLQRAGQSEREFLRGPWLAVMLATVGSLALVSLLTGLFPLGALNRLLAPVGELALLILDAIIYLIAFPIGWLLAKLLSALLGGRHIEMPKPANVASQAADQAQNAGHHGPVAAFFLVLFKFAALVLLAALIGYVIYRVFRRLRRPEPAADEVRESLGSAGRFGDELNALMQGLLGRFRRRPAQAEPSLSPGLLRVRRLYLRALDRSEEIGVPRPLAATPSEFSPALAGALQTETARTLSDRFAAARYGRIEPTAAELATLERELDGK